MANEIPTSAPLLLSLGGKNVEGMKAYADTLKITLITTGQCESNLAAFSKQNTNYNGARSAEQVASDAYQATLPPVYDWVLGVSNQFATRFGTRWNTLWAQAGWINHTTAIPKKIEDRLSLTLSIANFFADHPEYEVPTMNETAAYGMALREEALRKQGELMAMTIKLNDAGTAWNTAYKALTNGMRSLLRNLSDVLANNDPRWLAFGFTMPATPSTPGKPVNVTAQLDENGAILVQCPALPLSTRYRTRRRIVGVETNYMLASSSKEPMGWVKDILPGQTVEIIMQAVNRNLQGVPSDPIRFTIPPLAEKSQNRQPIETKTQKEGNGTAPNGRANGTRQSSLSN